jgi:hypothetical protein
LQDFAGGSDDVITILIEGSDRSAVGSGYQLFAVLAQHGSRVGAALGEGIADDDKVASRKSPSRIAATMRPVAALSWRLREHTSGARMSAQHLRSGPGAPMSSVRFY